MNRRAVACFGIVSALLGPGQAAGQPSGNVAATTARHRAVLDQYCVACHNDRLKTAQLSLEHSDLAAVGDHPELWEKVVRKLRAGVMPPPDVKRPPLRTTRACGTGSKPKSIGKPRASAPAASCSTGLNRTEYANAVRDLLDLDIDVSHPAAARRFSPGLRQHRRVADDLPDAPRVLHDGGRARRAHGRGYWKTPTEATYLAPGDTSQNQHVEGLPLGTRGGMIAHHDFPADGESRPRSRTSASAVSFPASSSNSSSMASAPTSSSTRASA